LLKNSDMRKRYTSLFILLSVFCIQSVLLSKEMVPLPLDHWSYPILEYFTTKRILKIDLQTKPVTREEVIHSLQEIEGIFSSNELDLDRQEYDLLSSLFDEFHPIQEENFRNVPRTLFENGYRYLKEESRLGAEFSYSSDESEYTPHFTTYLWTGVGSHISLAEEIKVHRNGNGSTIPGVRTWKDFAGTTPIATFNLSFPHLDITAGRNSQWLGPGRVGTLLVSDNYPFFDGVSAHVSFNKVVFSSYFTVINLDSMKFLSGHRLEIRDIFGFSLGFNECVLYSERIEPGYLNPLLILYGEQYNRGDRDNVFWSFDISYYFLKRYKGYGEFLIDDFQYESTPPAPNKVGIIFGLHASEPLSIPRTDLTVEYTRITKWTYSHKYPENSYTNYSVCLGHPFGPDADGIDIILRGFITWNIIPELHLGYRRKGEGSITEPWESGIDPHPPFPSGTVQSSLLFDASLNLHPFSSSTITPGWRFSKIDNVSNLTDSTHSESELFIDVSITF
jgi:hypothetical protein